MSAINWKSNANFSYGLFLGLVFFSDLGLLVAVLISIGMISANALVDLLAASLPVSMNHE